MLKVEKGETMARKANQRATNCLNTVLSPHHKRYITGTLSATPLFLFASGDSNPNLLKISTHKNRNSWADCRMVAEPRKQSRTWRETVSMEDKMAPAAFGRAWNSG